MWLCIIIYLYLFSTLCRCSRCKWDFWTTSGFRAFLGTIAALFRWSALLRCCSRSGGAWRGRPSRERDRITTRGDGGKIAIFENRYLYSITHRLRGTVCVCSEAREWLERSERFYFIISEARRLGAATPVAINDVCHHESVRRSPNKVLYNIEMGPMRATRQAGRQVQP